jgi:hypothetical protein
MELVRAIGLGWQEDVKRLLTEQLSGLGSLLAAAIDYRLNDENFAAFDDKWRPNGTGESLEEIMFVAQDFLGAPPHATEEKDSRHSNYLQRAPGDRAVANSCDSYLKSLPQLNAVSPPKDIVLWLGHACLIARRINAARATDTLAAYVWQEIGERLRSLLPEHYRQYAAHINARGGPFPILEAVYTALGSDKWQSALEVLETDLMRMPRKPFLLMIEFAKHCVIFRDLCSPKQLDTWKPPEPDIRAIRTLLTTKGLRPEEPRYSQIKMFTDIDYTAFVQRMTDCDDIVGDSKTLLHEIHAMIADSKNGQGPVGAGQEKKTNFQDEICANVLCNGQPPHTQSTCPLNRRKRSREPTPERRSNRRARSRSPNNRNRTRRSPSQPKSPGRRWQDAGDRRDTRGRSRSRSSWHRTDSDTRRNQYWNNRNRSGKGNGRWGGKGDRR